MSALKHFHHISIDNHAAKTLFLLHGTGGDEKDLLPLVEFAAKDYNFVGIRGNVSEQGMLRFFRRFEMGVFDQENIKEEVQKFSEFLEVWYKNHNLNPKDTAFVGYSNGANMILATLFLYPHLISRGILLHGMLPFEPNNLNLSGKSFVVSYGQQDRMIDPKEGKKVVSTLKNLKAQVIEVSHPGGHEIRHEEVKAMQSFLLG